MDSSYRYYLVFGWILLILLLLYIKYRNVKKRYAGIPIYPLVIKLIYWYVTRKIPKDQPLNSFYLQKLIDIGKKYEKEGLYLIWNFDLFLYIFSEESIKLFSNESSAFDKPPTYENLTDILGSGLVTSNGSRWKKHRKMINPVFHVDMLKDKIPIFNKTAALLVKDLHASLEKEKCTDLLPPIKRYFFISLCESILGLKNEDKGNENEMDQYFFFINRLCEMTVHKMCYPWLNWKFLRPFITYLRESHKMSEENHNFTKNVILRMKKHIITNRSAETPGADADKKLRKSFAHILLEHHLKDPSFTFDDLHGEVKTFMAAGYDTVSYTLLWCLFMLGLHPDVQEKAYNECNQSVHTDGFVTYDDVSRMTYLESIIMETLRLYPTVPLYARKLSKDVQCGKYVIPKDTGIVFFSYLWHRNPQIYPEPEVFDPERFYGEHSRKSWTHIPFAEGNRNCIGKKYALIAVKVTLAHILKNFKITSLDKREDIKLTWDVVLLPSKPLRMHLTSRSSQPNGGIPTSG